MHQGRDGGERSQEEPFSYPSYDYLLKHSPAAWVRPYYLPYASVNFSDPAYWTDLALTFHSYDAMVMEHGQVKGVVVKPVPPDWLQQESLRAGSDGQGARGGKEWQAVKLLLLLYWALLLVLGIWSTLQEWYAWWRVRKKGNATTNTNTKSAIQSNGGTKSMPFDLEAPSFDPVPVREQERERERERDRSHFRSHPNQPVVHIADASSTIDEESEEIASPVSMTPKTTRSSCPHAFLSMRSDPRLFMRKYAILFFLLLMLTLHALAMLYLWQTPLYATTGTGSQHADPGRRGSWQASDVSCTLAYYFLFQSAMLLLMIWHAVPIFRWTVLVQFLKRPPRHFVWYLALILPLVVWGSLSSAFVNGSHGPNGARSSGFPVIDTLYWRWGGTTALAAERVRVCYIGTWSLSMKLGLALPLLLCLGLLFSLVVIFRQRYASSKRALSRSKRLGLIFSIALLLLYGFAMLTMTDWHRQQGLRWTYEVLLFSVMTLRLAVEVWPWLVYLLGRQRQSLPSQELLEKGSSRERERDRDRDRGSGMEAVKSSRFHLESKSKSQSEPVPFLSSDQAEPSSSWTLPDSSSNMDVDAMGIAGLPPFPSHVRSLVQQGMEQEEPAWTAFKDLPIYASSYIRPH